MKFAENIADEMGFPRDKIEDLKVAVAEACLNAIEHGNEADRGKKITIDFRLLRTQLEIMVMDQGDAFFPTSIRKPNLRDIVEGKEKRKRGWGMFLMENMVDEMGYMQMAGGTCLRMVMKIPANGKDGGSD